MCCADTAVWWPEVPGLGSSTPRASWAVPTPLQVTAKWDLTAAGFAGEKKLFMQGNRIAQESVEIM